eukprot:TRINITY_DN1689_c0_g1_i1.p1 TRINITY_DN1689_c0_g1~~TRINITY_DN1689_c0_g1_i1.p1  ORF type:complete len:692 (+),score=215.32 TRINITY_DN1689_c0_g1_i1:135-2210(+)
MAFSWSFSLLFLCSMAQLTCCRASQSPVLKVVELLEEMQASVKREGVAADEELQASEEFCKRREKDLGFSIKRAENAKDELRARIQKAKGKINEVNLNMQEYLKGIARNEAELESATGVRNQEKATFEESQEDLLNVMNSLKRAVFELEKEEARGASLLQVQQAPDVLAALEVLVSGSMLGADDAAGLAAFLQQSGEVSPPQVPVYESQSGSIIDMLKDLQLKAIKELNALKEKEFEAKHNFEMLRQSLQDEIKNSKAQVIKFNATKSDLLGSKYLDEKDLNATIVNYVADTKEKKELRVECSRKKDDHRLESNTRREELEALNMAKDILIEKAGGAKKSSYSFMQVASVASRDLFAGSSEGDTGDGLDDSGVASYLSDLAKKTKSDSLVLLSRRISSMLRSGISSGTGVTPLEKVIKLVKDMIADMEQKMREEADKKAYCDKEMSMAKAKNTAKELDLVKFKTEIDAAVSKSTLLKADVADLQKEVAKLIERQATLTELRTNETKEFEKAVPELQDAIEGVKSALKVLSQFYSKPADDRSESSFRQGKSVGIIAMLETVQGDFAKNLAELRIAERTAHADYTEQSTALGIEKDRKEAEVKYKTKEFQTLDANVEELQSDTATTKEELAQILVSLKAVEAECIVPPETVADFMLRVLCCTSMTFFLTRHNPGWKIRNPDDTDSNFGVWFLH